MNTKMLLGLCALCCTLILALSLASPAPVAASSVDMRDATCADLTNLNEAEAGAMLFWLDGYLSGISDDTTFDSENLERFALNMGTYCASNPDVGILTAAKKIGLQ